MTMHLRHPYVDGNTNLDLKATPVPAPRSLYRIATKRMLDIAIVALLALPVLVIVAIVAIVVALDGHNPFYCQQRLGKNGKRFWLWKLRSMVPNADAKLQAYLDKNETARAEWEHSQKLRKDPRITLVGRFIRKTSLDELPQLFNVLRGDMSVVGPRPMMIEQRAMYPGTAYYEMRPGITGYWQVSERNNTSFSERAYFDTAYFKDVSLLTDLRVLWRTVYVVLRGTGC